MKVKNIKLLLAETINPKWRYFVDQIDKGIEAKNYLISVNNKENYKYILKIYSGNNDEELKYEIGLLNELNLNNKEKFFPIIASNIFSFNSHFCILYNYLPGRILRETDINSILIKQIAETQARMHKSLMNYQPKHKKVRYSIFDFSFLAIFLGNKESATYDFLKKETEILEQESKLYKKIEFQKSIIHEDLSPENIIISNSKIKFIDFGESHKAEIVSDVATAIKEIIINKKGLNEELIRNYLSSYQKIIHLKEDEIQTIPFLIRRRTIFIIAYFINRQKKDKNKQSKKKIDEEIKLLRSYNKYSYFTRENL